MTTCRSEFNDYTEKITNNQREINLLNFERDELQIDKTDLLNQKINLESKLSYIAKRLREFKISIKIPEEFESDNQSLVIVQTKTLIENCNKNLSQLR